MEHENFFSVIPGPEVQAGGNIINARRPSEHSLRARTFFLILIQMGFKEE